MTFEGLPTRGQFTIKMNTQDYKKADGCITEMAFNIGLTIFIKIQDETKE